MIYSYNITLADYLYRLMEVPEIAFYLKTSGIVQMYKKITDSETLTSGPKIWHCRNELEDGTRFLHAASFNSEIEQMLCVNIYEAVCYLRDKLIDAGLEIHLGN